MPATMSSGGGRKKSPTKPKSAVAGYTKTSRKDAKGRVIYTSKTGEDKVRCKATSGANAGKLTWRKASAQRVGGAQMYERLKTFGSLTRALNLNTARRNELCQALIDKINENITLITDHVNERFPAGNVPPEYTTRLDELRAEIQEYEIQKLP